MDRLIYANEVIEEIDEIIGNINFSSPYQNDIHLIVDGLERARDCVIDACTVNAVEVVHGQWMPTTYMIPSVMCSECSYTVGKEYEKEFKYCPNCGALMDGDKNG